jgi:hypothetical protein
MSWYNPFAANTNPTEEVLGQLATQFEEIFGKQARNGGTFIWHVFRHRFLDRHLPLTYFPLLSERMPR